MYTIVIKFIDVSNAKPNRKRFDIEQETVTRDSRESAWKLCLDTQRKAHNTPTVALVDIIVRDPNNVTVWTLR